MTGKLELRRGTVHCRPGWHGSSPTEPSLWAWPASSQTSTSWQGCSRVTECRGSAEARLHTEHGSGLLNDHANWLRSAPPEPRTVPTKSETALRFLR